MFTFLQTEPPSNKGGLLLGEKHLLPKEHILSLNSTPQQRWEKKKYMREGVLIQFVNFFFQLSQSAWRETRKSWIIFVISEW